ncbi:MAG: HNH endonuclease [Thermoanaerobaculia bacterium]
MEPDKRLLSFVRQVRKVRRLVAEHPDEMTLTFRLEVNHGQVHAETVGKDSPSKIRLAVLTRPLVHPESDISVARVWEDMKTCLPVDPVFVSDIEAAIARATTGSAEVLLNGERIPAAQLYAALAEGEFFQESPQASELRRALSIGPGREKLWMHFYSYCLDMYDIAEGMTAAILELRREPPAVVNPRCIYCLSTSASFRTEEHVVPEAFGNDDAILAVGDVCDECQATLSPLDQFLADFEGVALSRVIHAPHTKKGRLPRANFGNFSAEKVRPGQIRIIPKRGEAPLIFGPRNEDGTIPVTLHTRGRKPLDARRLGRALYKIGLAMIAFQLGRDEACDPRFDAARAFILGKQSFPNNLIVRTRVEPHSRLFTRLWNRSSGGGMIFEIDFWGLPFMLNVAELPTLRIDPNEPRASVATALWLGEDLIEG